MIENRAPAIADDSANPSDDDRERISRGPNPIGIEGIEFIEYTTPRPQALGQELERIGFRPIARHRSREVLLFRQGEMNLIVNAHPDDQVPLATTPTLAAFALRVRDARDAYRYVVEHGGWPVPVRTEVMELHIPAIRCAGGSRIYFVDRYRERSTERRAAPSSVEPPRGAGRAQPGPWGPSTERRAAPSSVEPPRGAGWAQPGPWGPSIYDVDFVPIPTVEPNPPALAGLDYFGIVQYIGPDRMADWIAFYRELLGFAPIPDEVRFGILPRGILLRSPCGTFYLQLVEADWDAADSGTRETLRRIGFGTADVPAAMSALAARGVTFIDNDRLRPSDRGAVTEPRLGGLMFELVHRDRTAASPDRPG